jgi:enolase-phosphatase E1
VIKAVITDIEGTTSSLAIVRDVLVPYARTNLAAYIAAHGDDLDVQRLLYATRALANEVGASIERTVKILDQWMANDIKVPPLKELQGLIWARGYADADLRSQLYPDVLPALRIWKDAGVRLFVYSSGSRFAQQLFFRYTPYGDLTPLFEDFFDTGMGPKNHSGSYRAIVDRIALVPTSVLYLSDSETELQAASLADLRVMCVARPGNGTPWGGPTVSGFDQIEVTPCIDDSPA